MASTMPYLPSAKHHCPLAGTKFYCLATGHKGVNSLLCSRIPTVSWTGDLLIVSLMPNQWRHHAHRKQKYYYHFMHGVVSLGRGFAVYKCFTEIPYRLNTLFYSMSHIMY